MRSPCGPPPPAAFVPASRRAVEPAIPYRGFDSLPLRAKKKPGKAGLSMLAEREGFEPSIRY